MVGSGNSLPPDEAAALMAGLQSRAKDSITLKGVKQRLHKAGVDTNDEAAMLEALRIVSVAAQNQCSLEVL